MEEFIKAFEGVMGKMAKEDMVSLPGSFSALPPPISPAPIPLFPFL